MRKLAIAAAGFAILAAALVFGLPALLNTPAFRAQVQSEIEKKLGRKVTFDSLDLRILPPSIALANTAIADAPGFPAAPFARAERFALRVGLAALLQGKADVRSISVSNPAIELIRNADGVWNYTNLGASSGSSDGSEPLKIALLEIEDGSVGITDRSKDGKRAQYDHIDIALRDYGSTTPFKLDAALRLPGQGKQQVELRGSGIAGGGGFNGSLKLGEASLGALGKFLQIDAADGIEGSATGETAIATRDGTASAKGKLDIADLRIRGQALGAPLGLIYDIVNEPERTVVNGFQAKVGSLALMAKGAAAEKNGVRHLDLDTEIGRASITELARLAALAGVAFGKDVDVKGQVAAKLRITGPASEPAIDGAVDAYGLDISSKAWKQAVRVPEIRIALTPEAIRAKDFTVEAGATHLGASFTLSGYASKTGGVLDASLTAREARLEELLRIAKAFGVGAAEDIEGTGAVTLDVRARGPVKKALTLSGTGAIADASLRVPALPKPLAVRKSTIAFAGDMVRLEDVTGSIGGSNFRGNLAVRDFQAPKLELALSVDQIDVSDLSGPAPAQTKAPARKGKRPIDIMTGSGRVEIGRLINGTLLLEKVNARCVLDKGSIRLEPLTAEVYGGKQTGAISIDMRPDKPRYDVRVKFDNVDANRLMSSTSALRNIVQGSLGAAVEVGFSLGEGEQIANTMNGKVAFRMGTGKILGVNLLNELAKLGQFIGFPAGAEAFTDLASLSASLNLREGLGSTDDLSLQLLNGGLLTATGTLNLTDQTVKMRTLTVFGKDFAELAGGTKIGGYLTAALVNEKGEMMMPTLITGPVSKMRIVPDGERLAQLKVRAITSPEGLRGVTEGVVDAIRNKRPDGLLDILRGKKKDAPKP